MHPIPPRKKPSEPELTNHASMLRKAREHLTSAQSKVIGIDLLSHQSKRIIRLA